MTHYVPVSSQEVGKDLSYSLWSFTRPPHVRSEREADDDIFAVVQDAAGQWYLASQDDFEIAVHALAEIDGVADILLGAGMTQAEVDQLASLVVALRGQRMRPYDYFPAVFKDAAKLETDITWPTRP